MTFEELQQQWKTQDAKLETILRLSVAQMSAAHFAPMKSALDRVRRSILIELFLNAVALVLLGAFNAHHVTDWRYLLPGAILHAAAIALFATGVNHLIALGRIDYACPVVDVQRRLTRLKMSTIRATKWTLLVAPALWTPLMLILLKTLLPIDVYATFDATWIAANIAFSLLFIPLMLLLARRFGDRAARSPLVQRLADDLAGRSLNEATAFAARLAQFETS